MPTGDEPKATLRGPLLRFSLTTLAIGAGLAADVTADGATWFGVRGPRCPLGSCFGELACPGCGLLRSTAAALQGDFALAWTTHPAGIAVAAILLGAAVVHFDVLRRRHEMRGHLRLLRVGRWAFATALLAGWLLRFLLN